jgi:short-subunit dehydrogenase
VQLAGATVLLTGASGGIGPTIARTLRGRGAALVLSGRRVDALEALAAELGARVLPADLARRDGPERLAREAGDVDVFVSNAALPADGQVDDYKPEEIDRALDVNLRAPIFLARALTPAMVERGRGNVVLMSSIAGLATTPGSALYSATKFGLRGFALGLREDLRDSGVGVSTVFPGFVSDAGMFHESGAKLPAWVATRTPSQVADAVLRAIEHNRSEVDVAPLGMRLGAAAAGVLPEVAARLQRRLGSQAIADEMADGQRDKR